MDRIGFSLPFLCVNCRTIDCYSRGAANNCHSQTGSGQWYRDGGGTNRRHPGTDNSGHGTNCRCHACQCRTGYRTGVGRHDSSGPATTDARQ